MVSLAATQMNCAQGERPDCEGEAPAWDKSGLLQRVAELTRILKPTSVQARAAAESRQAFLRPSTDKLATSRKVLISQNETFCQPTREVRGPSSQDLRVRVMKGKKT